jgi:6-pyruvoyltetrahydropterin/6-carboxytetrahydropterin synthase
MAFYSTKRFGPISVGHRQWKDNGHCAWIHGYGRTVQFTFGCNELDDKTWVVDFGGLKQVKQWIEEQWDHRLLLASNDPHLDKIMALQDYNIVNVNVMDVSKGHSPGIEGSCKFLYDNINPMILQMSDNRCWIESVEIWEHENNTAKYVKE